MANLRREDRGQIILVAAFAALSLALGTGGFSAAQVDRGVSVSVVDDEHAFVGIHVQDSISVPYGSNDGNGSDGRERVQVMALENNFGEPLTVDVTVYEQSSQPPQLGKGSDGHDSFTLDPNDGTHGVSFPVVCANANGGSETWTVSVTARTGGVTAVMDRAVRIECVKQNSNGENGPDSNGHGEGTSNANSDGEGGIESETGSA